MTRKQLRIKFALLAFLLLTPWPVAYAYDNSVAEPAMVKIKAAEPSDVPQMNVFRRAIGSVMPGNLFYVDTSKTSTDIMATLYLTNTEDLIHHYRYLTLKIGVYVKSNDGVWEKASGQNSIPFPETYLTLWTGWISFTLLGYAKYRVTVEGGNFYSITGNANGSRLSPRFYLTLEQT